MNVSSGEPGEEPYSTGTSAGNRTPKIQEFQNTRASHSAGW